MSACDDVEDCLRDGRSVDLARKVPVQKSAVASRVCTDQLWNLSHELGLAMTWESSFLPQNLAVRTRGPLQYKMASRRCVRPLWSAANAVRHQQCPKSATKAFTTSAVRGKEVAGADRDEMPNMRKAPREHVGKLTAPIVNPAGTLNQSLWETLMEA